MAPVGQGKRLVAAAMKKTAEAKAVAQKAAVEKPGAKGAAAGKKKKKGAGAIRDKGAETYYNDGHGEGFEEDDIHEVDPNVVSGRIPVQERPQMQSLFKDDNDGATDDDEPDHDKDALVDPRGRGSTHGSTGLQSGQSHVSRGGENELEGEVEEDPHPAKNGTQRRTSELAKWTSVSCII